MKNIFITISIFFLVSCNNISKEIESKILKDFDVKREMNFSTLNNFEWDELLILTPYTKISDVEKKYGLDLSKIITSIESNDQINTIVFLKNKKGIEYVELSRKYGDFTGYNSLIRKDKAVFKYRKVPMSNYKNVFLDRLELIK